MALHEEPETEDGSCYLTMYVSPEPEWQWDSADSVCWIDDLALCRLYM